MKHICCFAGHGRITYDENIRNKLEEKCRILIENCGVTEFWVGDYGNFDSLAGNVVKFLKSQYIGTELNLVIPYLTKKFTEHKELYYEKYDNIIMADISEKTPKQYRILKCNEYMAGKSDYLIAYVNYSYGGAFKTMEFASRKHIKIFNLGGLNLEEEKNQQKEVN